MLSVFALSSCANTATEEQQSEVAAVVEGREVLASAVDELTHRYLESPATLGQTGSTLPDLEEEIARRFVLNYLIRLTYLQVLADELGVSTDVDSFLDVALGVVSPEDFAELNMNEEDLRLAYVAGDLSRQIGLLIFPEVAVSEAEIRSVYESEIEKFQEGWSASVDTAYFVSRIAAEQMREAVSNGHPFLQMAEEHRSEEFGSMGVVTSNSNLSPQILETIGALESGETSEIIQASSGWLLFHVNSREYMSEVPYSEARETLLAILQDQNRQRLFDEWFQSKLSEANVEVAPVYGIWNSESGTVRSS